MVNTKLIDKLRHERHLETAEYRQLIENPTEELVEYAAANAREVAVGYFGTGIYIRGLIEVSSYCRNDCYYCGIRCSNTNLERYRLSLEEILECCRLGNKLGIRTFVLQGGEDPALREEQIVEIISEIRREFPEVAITLSLGEFDRETYQRFYDAGGNRYLLRHETANREHYGKLHPARMSFDKRMEALTALKEIGFQVGTGMMVGSPEQTIDNLVEDIEFIERFKPQMVGMGPYLPHRDTPFRDKEAGSVSLTLLLMSIVRMMMPAVMLPSTTALASIASDGRERGILAGCNVVMPNLSPSQYRARYSIYNNKNSFGLEAVEGLRDLEKMLRSIGYHISDSRGDYKDIM